MWINAKKIPPIERRYKAILNGKFTKVDLKNGVWYHGKKPILHFDFYYFNTVL